MAEKIEVGYKPVGGNDLGIYHKYILYTNSAGEQFYASSYPENYTRDEFTAGGGPGNIDPIAGTYGKGTRDWDTSRDPGSTAKPHERETIAEGGDLSRQWEKITERMREIGDAKIPYDPRDSNSNATADEALREAGLPAPQKDGPKDNWSPGSDYDLPGGDVPAPNTGRDFGDDFRDWVLDKTGLGKVIKDIKDAFDRAKNWLWPRDPIILDLDGDGLETVGLTAGAYFDFDADGVLTKTGWAGRDDALLVWYRNANGSIDTGAELFGDFTVLPNGTLAPNGFAALAALDANGDGILDASDPAFAELKLWRDTSQDGISQAGEFLTLAETGIVSLNLANTLKNQRLGNGNTLSREGSFTRADGTTSGMGEFRLAADTFSTQFADAIDVPESLKTLPTMGGAGNVRELQQAAAQSGSVAGVLAQFQSATTRAEQKALLDSLITAWADTSGMAKSLEERAAGKYRIQYEAFGNERRSSSIDTVAFVAVSSGSVGGGGGAALMTDFGGMYLSERYRTLMAEWSRKLHVLEAFNGQYFFNLPEKKSQTSGANWGLAISAGSGGGGSSGGGAAMAIEAMPTLRVNFSQAQLDLLQQAYDSLKESVYASLVMQTRLKPYLDQIELIIDDSGLRLDAARLNQTLADKRAADPENALADLLDMDRYAGNFLSGTNWQGLADFDQMIETLPQTAGITALLDEFKVRTLTGGDDSASLTNKADIVLAGESRRWRDGECANDEMWGMAA